MSKYLSLPGLRTVLSEVRNYVDIHAESQHSNIYMCYPVAPIYPDTTATGNGTLGPTFNARSVETRVIDDDTQQVYFPITTIDSVLNGAGTELWYKEFLENLNKRIADISPEAEKIFLSQKILDISQWRYRNISSDAQIITLIKALTGEAQINRAPLDGSATLVLDGKNDTVNWYLEIYRDQSLKTYLICDEAGNSDFDFPPKIKFNGSEYIADRLGLRPPGAFIASQDSYINPGIPPEYFDDMANFYQQIEEDYVRRQLISATSIIFFYSIPGNSEDYIIEIRHITCKIGNSGELDSPFIMAIRTDQTYSANYGCLWCAQMLIDDAGIEYSRELIQ